MTADTNNAGTRNVAGLERLVEHIRTVHFGLTVACIALSAALSLTFQPYVFRRALTECEAIQRLTGDSQWRQFWREYSLEQVADARRRIARWPVVPRRLSFKFLIPNYDSIWTIYLPEISWMIAQPDADPFLLHPSAQWQRNALVVRTAPPSSLNEFAKFWEDSLKPHSVVVPAPSNAVNIWREVGSWGGESLHSDSIAFDMKLDDVYRSQKITNPTFEVEICDPTKIDGLHDWTIPGYGVRLERGVPSDFPLAGSSDLAMFVPLEVTRHDVVSPATWLVNHYDHTWSNTAFAASFSELDKISTGTLRELPLDDLEVRLKASAVQAGRDVELMGVKLPSDVLTRFGPALLVAILFYLLMHLQVLKRKLTLVGQDLDFPWIGLYEGWLPRTAIYFTAVFLPVAVIIFGAIRALLLRMSVIDIVLQFFFLIIATLVSAGIARAIMPLAVLGRRNAMIISP